MRGCWVPSMAVWLVCMAGVVHTLGCRLMEPDKSSSVTCWKRRQGNGVSVTVGYVCRLPGTGPTDMLSQGVSGTGLLAVSIHAGTSHLSA